jgi:tRNA(Ile)-lysidine synthase
MFSQGETVNVAVSGGRDSVCLFHVLGLLGYGRRVLHLNHGLRPEAETEEEFVRELARQAGCEFVRERAHVPAGNLEQEARRLRQRFFRRFDKVATGHTRSDQAETVLFRLLRGTGSTGLRGILPVTREGVVRPLLAVERAQVTAWLAARGLPYRDDASNQSLEFARNRIRHQLLPQLEEQWNPALSQTLAHLADVAMHEEEYWDARVAEFWPVVAAEAGEAVLLRCPELNALPLALARRVVRQAARRIKGDLNRLDFPHIEQIRELAAAPSGSGRVVTPGVDVMRSFDWLRLATPAPSVERNWQMSVEFPFTADLPGGAQIRVYNKDSFGQALKPLILRNWRPGDRIRRTGETEGSRIKQLFQEARIPLWERRNWPVLVTGDDVLWSAHFGYAAGVAGLEVDFRPPDSFIAMNRDGGEWRP